MGLYRKQITPIINQWDIREVIKSHPIKVDFCTFHRSSLASLVWHCYGHTMQAPTCPRGRKLQKSSLCSSSVPSNQHCEDVPIWPRLMAGATAPRWPVGSDVAP